MKVLHIGDIHLGCRLDNNSRNEEIQKALDFIVKTVKEKEINAALIAGDVFDNGQPSAESQDKYYNFLLNLKIAGCRQVVVIAGNHDNPNFLDAPRQLLKNMEIHVVGNVDTEDLAKEVIPLGDSDVPYAFVCAVPQLKSRDVSNLIAEEQEGDAAAKYAMGVAAHYRKTWEIANEMRNGRQVPIIGMGHLYATGSSFRTEDDANVVGKLDGVELGDFAQGYDYMALGHIHKPQSVQGHGNWRYAGSLLAMKIQKHNIVPQVLVLDTEDLSNPVGIELPDECFHRMLYIEGDLEQLRKQLEDIRASNVDTWVKAVYTGKEARPNWAIDLRLETMNTKVQIVETDSRRGVQDEPSSPAKLPPLSELEPINVYDEYMEQHREEHTEAQHEECRKLFLEAQETVYTPEEKPELPVHAGGIMKFKQLYIKNVNSLYGENWINFEDPAFANGIFLISGPTGAGKSSILDAICIALYGNTPRISSHNGEHGISQNNNPVMSIGQKEMQVKLTFSMGEDEYCAEFSQKRTREGSKTEFRAAERKLIKNGQELENNISKINRQIEGLIGLDLSKFTQCVMLAQGGFNKFLNANDGVRSEILSSITGTEIYKKIGAEIARRNSEINNERKIKSEELKNISLLPEEKVSEYQATLEATRSAQDELATQKQDCATLELKYASLETAEANLTKAEKALAETTAEVSAVASRKAALTIAQQAQRCEEAYVNFTHAEDKMKKASQEQKELQEAKIKLEGKWQTADAAKKTADVEMTAMGKKQEVEQELFTVVRELDINIKNAEQAVANAETALGNAKTNKEKAEREFKKANNTWNKCQQAAEQSKQYLALHQDDQQLESRQEAWELRRQALQDLEFSNSAEIAALAKDKHNIEKQQRTLAAQEKGISEGKAKLGECKKALEDLKEKLDELQGGKTVVELSDLRAAAGKLQDFFKDNKSRSAFLTPSKPCPLCGSTVHPYCDGTAEPEPCDYSQTVAELTARLNAIEACNNDIQNRQQEINKQETAQAGLQEKCEATRNKLQEASDNLETRNADLSQKMENAINDAKVLAEEFRQALQVKWTDHTALPQELAQRIKDFKHAQSDIENLNISKQNYENAKAAYNAVKDGNEQALQTANEALSRQQKELEDLKVKRREKFGDDNVDKREAAIKTAMKTASERLQKATEAYTTADNNLRHNGEALSKNEQLCSDLRGELTSRQKDLNAKLAECGFEEIQVFKKARMTPEAIQALQRELTELDKKVLEKTTVLKSCKAQRDKAKNEIPEGMTREGNLETKRKLQEQLDTLQAQRTDLEAKLQNNEKYVNDSKTAREELAKLESSSNNWAYLNKAFGTNDGSAFEKIAQGYTFSNLLYCANANRLTSLRNHFTLINDKNSPLELNVIDHYRENKIRSSQNLSGGEQFEVSLALALGLAEMSAVSQKASLGNVLLDEGFGTLDDNALDSALDLLSQLNGGGSKLVGIISHVAKLGERIATKINVHSSGGIGWLEGAGVSRK